jgi:hypothetical protein
MGGNEKVIYSNTPYSVDNVNINLKVIVDLPAGEQIKEVQVSSIMITKKYVNIDVILESNTGESSRGVEVFNVLVPAEFRNNMTHFMFRVNGEKKKVVAANTDVHPEKID